MQGREICTKCKEEKNRDAFSKNTSRKNGLQVWCKVCVREYNLARSQTTEFKAYRKKYAQTAKHKEYRRRYNARYRKTESGKKAGRRNQANYAKRHPQKIKAKTAVNEAVKAKCMPKPSTLICTYCDKRAEEYHHYNGYDKSQWLDVEPVCRGCHVKL